MRKYPDIRYILSHAGGTVPYLVGRVKMAIGLGTRFKEAMPDGLESCLKRFYYDTAISAFSYAFAPLDELAGSSRIVFGTDYPFVPSAGVPITINGLRNYAGFDAHDVAAIERLNIASLFPRLSRD